MATSPRFLAVWLPDWPVQRARRFGGVAAGQAVAITDVSQRVERVTACCRSARRLGVWPGMRTAEAQAVAGPDRLTLAADNPREDRRRLVQLAEAAERFSPTVALEDADRPSALLLDIAGMWRLWGESPAEGDRQLAQAVTAWLTERGVEGRVAVAGAVRLALAAASSLRPDQQQAPPCLVVDPAQAGEVAARLPIESLGLEPEVIDKLLSFNLSRVGQLFAIPRSCLPSRFGTQLGVRLAQLLGEVAEPLRPERPAAPLAAEWRFETPVRASEVLESVVRQLLTRLESELAQSRSGALRLLVTCLLDGPQDSASKQSIELRLSRPSSSACELFELYALRSQGLRLGRPVTAVAARVLASVVLTTRQRTLFDDRQESSGFERDLLVNRLAARVGVERVCRADLRQSHDPHRAFQLLAAVDVPTVSRGLTPEKAALVRWLPLRLPAEGPRLLVEVGAHGAPRTVGQGGRRRVDVVRGPERVETGWWRGRPLGYDAYWVALEDGRWQRLIHDLRHGEWRLAGACG